MLSHCSITPKNYQLFLALVLAVTKINKDLVLLPNITLGFRIYDNSQSARRISMNSLSLLSTQGRMVPHYKCDKQDTLLSVIGDTDPKSSRQMASIFSILKVPQVRRFPWIQYGVDLEQKCTQKPKMKPK